jgi:MtN3 and saliva related transmembrane protein
MGLAASDIVGFAAGIITTAAYAPQVIKTVRTRSTKDISLGMYLLLAAGIGLWLVHGFQIGSLPVMAANGFTLILVGIMLYMKLRYK